MRARAFFPNFDLRCAPCGQRGCQMLLVEEVAWRGHVSKKIVQDSLDAVPQFRVRSKLSLKPALEFSQVRPRLDDGHNVGRDRVRKVLASIDPEFCSLRR